MCWITTSRHDQEKDHSAFWIWRENAILALVVAVAIVGSTLVAGLAGVLITLALKSLRLDPALASGVILTTFTDVCGILLLFGLSLIFLPVLL